MDLQLFSGAPHGILRDDFPQEMVVVFEEGKISPRVFVLMKTGRRYLKVPASDAKAWLDPASSKWHIKLEVEQVDTVNAEEWTP